MNRRSFFGKLFAGAVAVTAAPSVPVIINTVDGASLSDMEAFAPAFKAALRAYNCIQCKRALVDHEIAIGLQRPPGTDCREGSMYCDPCWTRIAEALCGPPGYEGEHGYDGRQSK